MALTVHRLNGAITTSPGQQPAAAGRAPMACCAAAACVVLGLYVRFRDSEERRRRRRRLWRRWGEVEGGELLLKGGEGKVRVSARDQVCYIVMLAQQCRSGRGARHGAACFSHPGGHSML